MPNFRNGNMYRNGSAPKVNPGDIENNILESFELQLPWPQRGGTGHKGGDPTGLPECQTFVTEIFEEIALPPRSTLGTSKNNFLEPFEPGPQGLIMCLRINQTV